MNSSLPINQLPTGLAQGNASSLSQANNLSGHTTNAAYANHISTLEGLVKKGLFVFKLALFTKILRKDSSDDYSFDQGLTHLSQKCISQQKNTMELNILGLEDDIDTCVNLYGYMRLVQ